ncbi:MAG: thioredoxin [Anaerolineae bacterium]
MSKLAAVHEATFDAQVLQAQLPTLVDFSAEWCGPCRMMAPMLEKIAQEQADKLQIVQVDVQTDPEMAVRFGVVSLPSLLLFVGGEVKERMSGYMPATKVLEHLYPYLSTKD